LFSWIISRICVEDLGQNLFSSAAVEAYDCWRKSVEGNQVPSQAPEV
jgi:hypothetical protein